MQKLDSKKIDAALKSLENAGKGALRSLNEMTDNDFKGSTMEEDPLNHLAQIVRILQKGKEQAALDVKYEGMDVDQITEAQEQARAAELESIQIKFNEKLAKRMEKPEPEVLEETESEGNPDDQEHQS
ncbi:hypothetical protein [Spirosoma sp.]|uniref:hypothetical protein n=1 Tax=Spirosoma sp. TaxID=1899569 RepID=UPI002606909E|nr:hypothetical protein [Spirosoma sp.]MCX6216386.1 hypothetical protein [Spirosoma sp.]